MIPFTIDHVKTNIAGPPVGVESEIIILTENPSHRKFKIINDKGVFFGNKEP